MKNALFIHNPKTAGSHTIKALGLQDLSLPNRRKHFNQTGHVTFGHQDYVRLIKKGIVSKEFDSSAWKFCFCRNPYDRAVSHYFYVRKSHPDILPSDITFEEYIKSLGTFETPGRLYGRVAGRYFFRPQIESIRGVELDFIGRFETFKEDLKWVSDILQVKLKRYKKIRATRHLPYREYYTKETANIVKKFYREDFKYFGYDNNLLHGE